MVYFHYLRRLQLLVPQQQQQWGKNEGETRYQGEGQGRDDDYEVGATIKIIDRHMIQSHTTAIMMMMMMKMKMKMQMMMITLKIMTSTSNDAVMVQRTQHRRPILHPIASHMGQR